MVVLVVDVQELINTDELYDHRIFLSSLVSLISSARKSGVEVIYIRHDDGPGAELSPEKPGYDIAKVVEPEDNERIFDKKVNSPFRDSGLQEYLNEKGVSTVIVAGLQTEYCIDATVKCGFEHGFSIIVPAGCNTTMNNEFMTGEETYKYYNEFIWKNRYARCLSLDETVKMIEEYHNENALCQRP